MADTLIDVINEVLTATGQRANKTTIAATDSTAYLRDRVNDALDWLYKLKPFVVDADGTVTITPAQRTFNGPLDTELQNIHPWSLRINDSDGDIPVSLVTEQFIIENYPDFETAESGSPQYVYFSNGSIAVYPLLETVAANLTLQFKYATQFTKLTSAAATFPFEDRSDEMKYVKLFTQLRYEVFKGLGQPGVTNDEMEATKARIIAKHHKSKRVGFKGSRRYGW
ncbi:MAG: hypothetical protein K0Q50_709 [Vampirovibrio sp.]|jgi:hypothetical protein|nr:hypothetical protein [Vampirovibrio sp.]